MTLNALWCICTVFAHDPLSSSGYIYPMITYMYTHPVANNLPIKVLVARQLQHTHTHILYM